MLKVSKALKVLSLLAILALGGITAFVTTSSPDSQTLMADGNDNDPSGG